MCAKFFDHLPNTHNIKLIRYVLAICLTKKFGKNII